MKYLGLILIILSFIAIAQIADIDGADKSYTQNGCGSSTVLDNQTNSCRERDDSG